MTILPRFALLLCAGVLCAALPAHSARAESVMSGQPEKSFTQSVKDSYHEFKDSVTQAFGGYTGNPSADSKAYMEHYKEDLQHYHDSLREARDDYRKARLSEQKSYLEHHGTLPMEEDIDSDVKQSDW